LGLWLFILVSLFGFLFSSFFTVFVSLNGTNPLRYRCGVFQANDSYISGQDHQVFASTPKKVPSWDLWFGFDLGSDFRS